MSRYSAYLRNAALILGGYTGEVPLSVYLKRYFAEHKKYGSTDRKQVTSLCYQFFRIGKWAAEMEVIERLKLAEFLLQGQMSPYFLDAPVHWEISPQRKLLEKGSDTGIYLTPEMHTPWYAFLQPETEVKGFVQAMLAQPDLFLRIRPGKEKSVFQKLEKEGLTFQQESNEAIRLPITSRISDMLSLNKEVVVQDLNSQQCGQIIKKVIPNITGPVWDVCAASGGKSLLLHDLYGGIQNLIVTDIRPSILQNLSVRFKEANVLAYQKAAIDVTKPLPSGFFKRLPQVIVIDAPCTGSGTWPRTPEQHYYFDSDSLSFFQKRQYDICCNALNYLEEGNYFIYITCSVFAMENDQIVQKIHSACPLKLLHQEVLNGNTIQADSMFIAIFQRKQTNYVQG